jgi:dCMP deaminase
MAKLIADWSKDPSTKCGAIIVRPDRTIASVGYNGFPRGCDDDPALYDDRETKYSRIVHCEMNAILSAREPLKGYTLYTVPFISCDRCASHVVQAGIARCVAPAPSDDTLSRWTLSIERSIAMFDECGVTVDFVPIGGWVS